MNNPVTQTLMMILLIHLIFVFVLPKRITKKKKLLPQLIFPSLLYGVFMYIALGSFKEWLTPLLFVVTHFLISWIREYLIKKDQKFDNLTTFISEQLLYLVVILVVVKFSLVPRQITPYWYNYYPDLSFKIFTFITGLILLLPFSSRLIGYFVKRFQVQLLDNDQKRKPTLKDGLQEGGKIIGFLERLLILVFILNNQFAGVGFLVTAKSVFRFGELKDGDNRKQAEYIIIGTFASFLLAIIISLGLRALLGLEPTD